MDRSLGFHVSLGWERGGNRCGKSISMAMGGGAAKCFAAATLGSLLSLVPLDVSSVSASILSENTLLRRYVVTSGDSLLRYALPLGDNEDKLAIRKLQLDLEKMEIDFRSKGPAALRGAKRDIQHAQELLSPGQQLNIVLDVPKAKRDEAFAETRACSKDLDELAKIVDGEFSLKNKKTGFDRTKLENPRKSALDHVLNIETLMAPDKLPFRIPARYDHLPRLTGKPVPSVVVEAIVDGYSAPLTAGSFVDLVQRGYYDGKAVTAYERGQTAIIGGSDGFVENGKRREIPLEVKMDGERGPLWGNAVENVDIANLQPVLPTTAFGALSMNHSAESINDASGQLCIFLLDPRSMAARSRHGNIQNGTISNFGYAVKNADYLSQLEVGDQISRARVISGIDRLVIPQ